MLPPASRLRFLLAVSVLVSTSAQPATACPWHESMKVLGEWFPSFDELAAWPRPPMLAPAPPAGGTRVPIEGGPPLVGEWSAPLPWEVRAIHSAMLPTGKVLQYAYPGSGGSAARLWDPGDGSFEDVSLNQDIFCSGLSLLPDGRLFAAGGNDYECEFQGRQDTHVFNPFTSEWTRLGDMTVGRWYPSNVTMPDGRVLILSGLGRDCLVTDVMEIYTPGVGLEVVAGGQRQVALYPRLHLLSSGLVAHVGPEPTAWTFDLETESWQFVDSTVNASRYNGTSFLVPGETDVIMICTGSAETSLGTCERIDFGAATPTWQEAGALNLERAHSNVVILPDRKVLLIGGGTDGLYGDPVFNAELYDPDTDSWTLLPAQAYGRMYHSTAVLLPDGRVLSAGQDSGVSSDWSEIYSPPYLFQGARPEIASAPGAVAYGTTFEVESPEAAAIAEVALIALTTVTHSVNNGQRYVGLDFTATAGELSIAAPSGGTLAPPGYYMLFLVDGAGVPSEAAIVRLGPALFSDGFESGDVTAWSSSSGF